MLFRAFSFRFRFHFAILRPADGFISFLLTQRAAHSKNACLVVIKTSERQFCDRPAKVWVLIWVQSPVVVHYNFLFHLFATFFCSGIYLMLWLMMDGAVSTQFGFSLAFVSAARKLCPILAAHYYAK